MSASTSAGSKRMNLPTRWKAMRRSATRRRTNLGVTERRFAASLMVSSGLGAAAGRWRQMHSPCLGKAVAGDRNATSERSTSAPTLVNHSSRSLRTASARPPPRLSADGDRGPPSTSPSSADRPHRQLIATPPVDRPHSCITMRCRSRSRFVPGLVQRSVQAGGVSLGPCCRWARSRPVRAGTTWRPSLTAGRTTTRSQVRFRADGSAPVPSLSASTARSETTTSSLCLSGSHLSMASGCVDRTGECRDSI